MRRAFKDYAHTPPAYAHEKADCAVRAVRVASGRPYADVHGLLKVAGRKGRHGTFNHHTGAVCKLLGAVKVDTFAPAGDGEYERPRYMTVAQFLRAYPTGTFACARNGHYFAIVDGVVHDWQRSRTGSRSRVHTAWRFA